MVKNHATKRRFYKNALALYTLVQNFIRAFCSMIRYNSLCRLRVSDCEQSTSATQRCKYPAALSSSKVSREQLFHRGETRSKRKEKSPRRCVALRCTSRTRNANCLVKRATRDKESITNESSTASRATRKKVAVASENRAKVLLVCCELR